MYCEFPELGRCCFCLPLRRGILLFGYINILFCGFMIGVYSYCVHHSSNVGNINILYHGATSNLAAEFCVAIYCIELLVNCLLVYGAHKKILKCLQIFYYYTIATSLAALLMEIVGLAGFGWRMLDEFGYAAIAFTGLCLQMYLVILVRSLMRKLEDSGSRAFQNPLHSGTRPHYIYNHTTEPPCVKSEEV